MQQTVTVQEQSVTVHVQLPPPGLLAEYERVRPGTMDLLVRWNEEEQSHQRRMDQLAIEANIEAQRRQLDLAGGQLDAQRIATKYQARTVRSSDMLGQVFGWLLSAGAVGLATYLDRSARCRGLLDVLAAAQASLGRTCRTTWKLPGSMSNFAFLRPPDLSASPSC
ncbi:hypothetical protein [Roseateles cellulosilyticus]|uniref:hypothetical protein n=1 Tax=Pelomonas cellulosilytica TaxID=2906762 RepID=UPI0032C2264A